MLFAAIWILTSPCTTAALEPQSPAAPAAVSLDAAAAAARELTRLHSLLVSWRGELILERYYNGASPARLANIKSASKSVLSALVGIAIERGLIADVKQPIVSFFPRLLANGDASAKREITIEDLLTMRSGLETTSNRNYGRWVQSPDWVRFALAQPLLYSPGTTMEYSTGNAHLLSAILTKVTGKSTWEFAQEMLARPLGFALPKWPQDPQGIYFGGNDMLLTPRQMIAFGKLYLNRGRSGERQVVPAEWVEASFVPRAQSRRESGRFYGYGWWIRELAGRQTFYAWGYGGQFIFVVPELDLVIAATSSSEVSVERRSHLRAIYDVVEDMVIRPVSLNGTAKVSISGPLSTSDARK